MNSYGLKLVGILLGFSLLISCNEKKGNIGDVTVEHYSLGLSRDGKSYSVSTDSLFGKTITLKGNSTQLEAKSLIVSGKYFYFFNRPEKKFYQYELEADGAITEKASLEVGSYVTDHAYSQNLVDDQTILIMDPVQWGEPEVKWFTIRIPDLVITASGSFRLPALKQSAGGNWKSNVGRGVLHAGKFIMGTVYYDFEGNFASGSHAVTFDFPGMTNPKRISTNNITAELGIFSNNGFVKTENGDLYIIAARGAILGAITSNEQYGAILRIKKGELQFDDSYLFDLAKAVGAPTNITQLDYLGGSSAMAIVFDDTKVKGWGDFDNDHYFFAKLDLESQQLMKYNVPKSDARITKFPLITPGKYITFLKIAKNQTCQILEITTDGGPDAFRKGAVIDGKDLRGYSIIKHPRR